MSTMSRPPRNDIAFRACVEADVPFLRALYGTTREEEMRVVPWTEEQKAQFLDMQFRAQKQHYEEFYPDSSFLVIELEGKPVGRLYIQRDPEELHLIDIALMPDVRGRGIGSMLLEEIQEEARTSERRVTIYVEHFNPARALYDRLGFRHIDTNGVYHLMEWRPEGQKAENRKQRENAT
jgi:ribosomal protein S18 acetylase RimI-like enzyme